MLHIGPYFHIRNMSLITNNQKCYGLSFCNINKQGISYLMHASCFSRLSSQFTYWVGGLLVEHLKVLSMAALSVEHLKVLSSRWRPSRWRKNISFRVELVYSCPFQKCATMGLAHRLRPSITTNP